MGRPPAGSRAPKLSLVRRGPARVAHRHLDPVGRAGLAGVSPHRLGVLARRDVRLPAGASLPSRFVRRPGRRPPSATHHPGLHPVVGDGARVRARGPDVGWSREGRAHPRARGPSRCGRDAIDSPTRQAFVPGDGRPREPRERNRAQHDDGHGRELRRARDRGVCHQAARRGVVLPGERRELPRGDCGPPRHARLAASPEGPGAESMGARLTRAFGSRRPTKGARPAPLARARHAGGHAVRDPDADLRHDHPARRRADPRPPDGRPGTRRRSRGPRPRVASRHRFLPLDRRSLRDVRRASRALLAGPKSLGRRSRS